MVERTENFCEVRAGGVAGPEALVYLRECCQAFTEETGIACMCCRAVFEEAPGGVFLRIEVVPISGDMRWAEETAPDAMLAVRGAFAQLYRGGCMRGSVPPPPIDWTRAH